MSSDIVLFQGMDKGGLTAYLASAGVDTAVNDDVSNYQSFPSISIKGGRFTLVEGDNSGVMMRPGSNPPEPAQSLNMVILRANDKARTYYDKPYDPNQVPPPKPTCYSNDNIAPSDLSLEKQSPQCPTCRWSVFGTARKQDGTAGKGTACGQNARLAVAAADALDKPHMLRAPATSLRPLRDAIDVVRKRNIPYPLVVMNISFDPNEASPLLRFTPVGLVPKDDAKAAVDMREDSVVRAICGLDERAPAPAAQAPAAAPAAPPVNALDAAMNAVMAGAAQSAATPTSTPVQAPASVAAPSPTPVAPPVAATASVPASPSPSVTAPSPTPTVTVATGDLVGDLGRLLDGLDG